MFVFPFADCSDDSYLTCLTSNQNLIKHLFFFLLHPFCDLKIISFTLNNLNKLNKFFVCSIKLPITVTYSHYPLNILSFPSIFCHQWSLSTLTINSISICPFPLISFFCKFNSIIVDYLLTETASSSLLSVSAKKVYRLHMFCSLVHLFISLLNCSRTPSQVLSCIVVASSRQSSFAYNANNTQHSHNK